MNFSDRFKFRAWDKEQKQMYDWEDDFGNVNDGDGLFTVFEQLTKQFILMQCTGLKDKNGKLIYEGDIVNFTYKDIYPRNGSMRLPVSFYEGLFMIVRMNEDPISLREAIRISNEADGLEIISNIYETPNLLAKVAE